jgi:hypothetical protein
MHDSGLGVLAQLPTHVAGDAGSKTGGHEADVGHAFEVGQPAATTRALAELHRDVVAAVLRLGCERSQHRHERALVKGTVIG